MEGWLDVRVPFVEASNTIGAVSRDFTVKEMRATLNREIDEVFL